MLQPRSACQRRTLNLSATTNRSPCCTLRTSRVTIAITPRRSVLENTGSFSRKDLTRARNLLHAPLNVTDPPLRRQDTEEESMRKWVSVQWR